MRTRTRLLRSTRPASSKATQTALIFLRAQQIGAPLMMEPQHFLSPLNI
jgi:hypothetical protein